MLQKQMWLIDHGAALYFHHYWPTAQAKAGAPFEAIKDHILLSWATDVPAAAKVAHAVLTEIEVRRIVELVPGLLLHAEGDEASDDERRAAYVEFFLRRLELAPSFEEEIERARNEVL
jgi:hypothetical protein